MRMESKVARYVGQKTQVRMFDQGRCTCNLICFEKHSPSLSLMPAAIKTCPTIEARSPQAIRSRRHQQVHLECFLTDYTQKKWLTLHASVVQPHVWGSTLPKLIPWRRQPTLL
jgi:hypothetical protein